MTVSINLQKILDKHDITLYKMCKDTGLSYQQGSAILKNKTKRINFETIESLCGYFNCDISDVLEYKKEIGILEKTVTSFPKTKNSIRESSVLQNRKAKPFLQWVGGKREMIPQYKEYFPRKFNRYIEPFVGGGAMFFELQPEISVLNDNNLELIKTYRAIRDNPYKVISLLKTMKVRHSKELFMKIREMDRNYDLFKDFSDYEVAARMIYLNQTCFNGVYRVNKKGQFNVPIGSTLDRLICDDATIYKASDSLQKVKLECEDFSKILNKAKKGDFVYIDPPYVPVSIHSNFTRYTKEQFNLNDQERLKKTIDLLSKKGVKVMASNSDCEYIRDLYSDYQVHEASSSRSLNSKVQKRGRVSEVLITNYL